MRHSLRKLRTDSNRPNLLGVVCANIRTALFITDELGRCIYMNPAAETLTGHDLQAVRDRLLHDVLRNGTDEVAPEEDPVARTLRTGEPTERRDLVMRRDGRAVSVEYLASPVIDDDGAVVGTVVEARDITEELAWARSVEDEARMLEILHRAGAMLTAKLDLDEIVQAVTDAATDLSGAEFGALFYNAIENGRELQLYTLAGAARDAFSGFSRPQHTGVFGPTFGDGQTVRSDDITADPRYGQYAPFHGMPPGHLPVRSYLAVPVVTSAGEIFGALIFGHSQPGRFSERAERIVTALALQAAIAIENARLYQAAQTEIAERQRSEEHQKLLVQELNHRVKNMLATVQSIATQTFSRGGDGATLETFIGRLHAFSDSHSLIMGRSWGYVRLHDLAQTALAPFLGDVAASPRAVIEGPDILLPPRTVLALGLGFHELTTNAVKHGALSTDAGRVEIRWHRHGDGDIALTWTERDGPPTAPPRGRGFGSRLLERGLANQTGGTIVLEFEPEGLCCRMTLPAEALE